MIRRCYACGFGLGTVVPMAKAGRTIPYKDMVLPIPDDFILPECTACGEQYIGPEEAARLDVVLETIYVGGAPNGS